MVVQLGAQCGDQVSTLLIDRADTVEVVIVLGNFQQPLARDVAAPRDIFEERQNIVPTFWAAKRNQQNRVVTHRRLFSISEAVGHDLSIRL